MEPVLSYALHAGDSRLSRLEAGKPEGNRDIYRQGYVSRVGAYTRRIPTKIREIESADRQIVFPHKG